MTEKYWERLEQDSVPVVMGSNYDMLAVSGSYINADDFKSIKELASICYILIRMTMNIINILRTKQILRVVDPFYSVEFVRS